MLDQYQVLDSIVLEDLLTQESSSFYRFLNSVKRDIFHNPKRIVFYNYTPLPSDLIQHIKDTIVYLDIPDFFILVVDSHQTYQFADYEFKKSDTTEHKPVFNIANSMCAHAWAGIHVWPDGTCGACCDSTQKITKPNGEYYNIKENTIEQILDSTWMQDLRQQFRENKKANNCQICWQREELQLDSKRTLTPHKLENIYGLINWEQEGQLAFLGGHMGNLCNLKCRICSSAFSSSIANELLSELPRVDRKKSKHYTISHEASWASGTTFWDQVKQLAPKIKNFEFLGGEPFLLKQNNDFIEFLIENDLGHDTIFYFNTNGTQYPKILDHADQLKKLEITISIDNIDDRFELERSGAKWADVENNIRKFVKLGKKIKSLKIDIAITVNIQNVFYLPEIIDWANLIEVDSYYLNYVTAPTYLAVDSLTAQAKELVLDKLSNYNFSSDDQEKVRGIIDKISNIKPGDGKEFCKEMRRFDRLRNQNFLKTHTDIAKAMGYG